MTTNGADRVERGTRLVGAGIIVSRVLGLVRQRVVAGFFGTTVEMDAYNAALKIPNALRNLLGEGAISASFIPVYSAALARGDERGARALANALLGVLIAVIAALTLIGIAAAPLLTAVLVPGFTDIPGKAELTTRLMRVLFPMTGLMVLSGWCLGIQNSHRRFFLAYASGAMWSIAQIVLLLVAGPGESDLVQLVWLLSWATLVGAILQIAVQTPQVFRLVQGIRPSMDVGAPGLNQTLRNFVPVVGALGLFQISSLIDQRIASWLPSGSVSSLNYANVIYLLPLSLFGVATAAAALPQMSRDYATGERESLTASIGRAWQGVLFYTIPSAIAFVGIGDCIVTLLYGTGGKFGPDEAYVVRVVLAAYAFGLVAYATARLLTSLYQATGNYRRPFICSATAIVVSASISLAFALSFPEHRLAVAGLALGGALGAHVNLVMLWRGLPKSVGRLDTREPIRIAARTFGVGLVALAPAVLVRFYVGLSPQLLAVLVIVTYCAVFILVARQVKIPEATRMVSAVMRRFGK